VQYVWWKEKIKNKNKIRVPVQRNAFSRRTSIHTAAAVLANKCNPLSYRLDSVVIFSSTPDFSRLSGTLVYTPKRTHTDKDIILCVLVLSLQTKKKPSVNYYSYRKTFAETIMPTVGYIHAIVVGENILTMSIDVQIRVSIV